MFDKTYLYFYIFILYFLFLFFIFFFIFLYLCMPDISSTSSVLETLQKCKKKGSTVLLNMFMPYNALHLDIYMYI